MDFNTAMAKSVAWASTSFAVIAALSYTKRTIMLNGISSSAVCWITCTLMRRN